MREGERLSRGLHAGRGTFCTVAGSGANAGVYERKWREKTIAGDGRELDSSIFWRKIAETGGKMAFFCHFNPIFPPISAFLNFLTP